MRRSNLGKKRRKLRKWRRPTGRHSKMRQQRKSYPARPTVGHKTARKDSGKIHGLKPILVHNLTQLSKLDKNSAAILARIGAKKKLELIKYATEKNIKIINLGNKK